MVAGDVSASITDLNSKPCAVFDGTDDKVEIADTDSIRFNSGSQDFTISLWVYKSGADGLEYHMLGKQDGAADGYRFIISNNDKIQYDINAISKTSSNTIPRHTWTHLCLVVDRSANAQLYINGVADGAGQAINGEVMSTTGVLAFGVKSYGAQNYLPGAMKDIRFYNRSLSTTKVTSLTNGGNVTDGLIHKWLLKDDYTDSVGSKDGTNSGTYLTNLDDAVATAIATQRVLGTLSGSYLIAGVEGGQFASVGITETA